MSAVVLTLRTDASEVPAIIAGSVNLMQFSEALARAGLIGRHDAQRGVLVIEPLPARCRACGGSGLDEDSQCGVCDGTGRGELPPRNPADALVGMCWYNGLTRAQPLDWHQRAGSAVPADAWKAFKAGEMTRAG